MVEVLNGIVTSHKFANVFELKNNCLDNKAFRIKINKGYIENIGHIVEDEWIHN